MTTTKQAIKDFIASSKDEVFVRPEFNGFGSRSNVNRCLRELIDEVVLYRSAYGVYAKARMSGDFFGPPTPIPRVCVEEVAYTALQKLGVRIRLGRAAEEYASGRTTQIPVHPTLNTGGKRISRKFCIGQSPVIRYENDYQSRMPNIN